MVDDIIAEITSTQWWVTLILGGAIWQFLYGRVLSWVTTLTIKPRNAVTRFLLERSKAQKATRLLRVKWMQKDPKIFQYSVMRVTLYWQQGTLLLIMSGISIFLSNPTTTAAIIIVNVGALILMVIGLNLLFRGLEFQQDALMAIRLTHKKTPTETPTETTATL